MVRISKTLVAGISALAMAAAIVLPTTPASAGGWGGGGFHGGGFHGGGWHGGGWGVVACGVAVTGTAAGGARRSPRAC
jgi:Spy/CpxP family protein refolding chaperone